MPRGDACPGIGHLHHACLAWRYLRPIEPEYLGLTFSVGCWLLTAWCGVASLVCWRGCGCGFVVVVGVVEHSTGVFNCLPRQDPWMDEMNKRALARPGRSGPTPPQSPTCLLRQERTTPRPATPAQALLLLLRFNFSFSCFFASRSIESAFWASQWETASGEAFHSICCTVVCDVACQSWRPLRHSRLDSSTDRPTHPLVPLRAAQVLSRLAIRCPRGEQCAIGVPSTMQPLLLRASFAEPSSYHCGSIRTDGRDSLPQDTTRETRSTSCGIVM